MHSWWVFDQHVNMIGFSVTFIQLSTKITANFTCILIYFFQM
uniref:Uncharacterized protein n=1 Tax=Klebsiella pneumoniae TaxID=573 RepID=A0A6M6A463_KLEPN|nr:hypothetical protein [Klebsiella pneumoniae]